MSNPDSLPAPRRHWLEALVLAFVFAVAHTQSPLYYSNQNQYLLHGAALGSYGHLASDWLATTRDPTPLFSALVAGAYATCGPWLLQPAYFMLLVGYFLTARWLITAVPSFPNTRSARIVFAALFTAAHAAILRWASVQLTGTDYPWYFQSGLAAQYLLGPGIQPSAFGVLLLVAVAAFAHGKQVAAAVLTALAVVCHGTYALPSALLTLGFMATLARAGRWGRAVSIGTIALLVVSPVVVYDLYEFTAPRYTTDEAARILASVRIPHHCVPARWFDAAAGAQLAWCTVGLLLLRRTSVFVPLVIATTIAVLLTVVQLETRSFTLALMFPWRLSVLLVPVATAVVIAKARAWRPPGRWTGLLAGVGLVALVVGGVVVTACGLGYRTADEHELYDYVRATAGPHDVYLLPVQFPGVGSGRGAVSNTFTSPPRSQAGANQIPVDLQQFRLVTGACVYVDFKSVPYAPGEVLEWNRRMTVASEMTRHGEWNHPERREELTKEGITHVVSPRTNPITVGYLEEVHRDAAYIVYRVK